MKKLTILLAILLLAGNNVFSQKKNTKTKPSTKPAPVMQMDFQNKFYGSIGISQIGDEMLGNAMNFLAGLETQVSQYISIGGGFNYSSYPGLTDKMSAKVLEILQSQGIGPYKLQIVINDFDVSCFELEGQMRIKFSKSRDGFYSRLGFAIMFLTRSKYNVEIKPWIGEESVLIMNEKNDKVMCGSIALGYELDISRNVGLWSEFKMTPSLRKSSITDENLFQTNFAFGFYYRY